MRWKTLQAKSIERFYSCTKDQIPKVFQCLCTLKGYQLRIHIDKSVQLLPQPVRKFPLVEEVIKSHREARNISQT